MATSDDIIKELYAYAEDSTNKKGYIGTKTMDAVDSMVNAIKSASAKITEQMIIERFVPKSVQKAAKTAEKKKKSSNRGNNSDEKETPTVVDMSIKMRKDFERIFSEGKTSLERMMIKQNIKFNNKLLPLMIDYYRDLKKEKNLDPQGMGIPEKTGVLLDDAKKKGDKTNQIGKRGGGLGFLGLLGGLGALLLGFEAIAKDSKILQSIKIGVKLLPTFVSKIGNLFKNLAAMFAKGGKFNEPLMKLAGRIKTFFNPLTNFFKSIGNFFKPLTNLFKGSEKAVKAVGKTGLLKGLFKGLGKTVLRRIPIIGSIINIGEAIAQFSSGDKIGGVMSLVSAIANLFPGIGTGISIVIDLLQLARNSALTKDERANMGFGDQLKKVGGFIWEKIKEWAGKIWEWVKEKFVEGLTTSVNLFKNAWNAFKDKFPDIAGALALPFKLLKGAVDGISSFVSNIIKEATDMIDTWKESNDPNSRANRVASKEQNRAIANTMGISPRNIRTKEDMAAYHEGMKIRGYYSERLRDWSESERYADANTHLMRKNIIRGFVGKDLDAGEMNKMNRFLSGEQGIKGLEHLYSTLGHNLKDAKKAYDQIVVEESRENRNIIKKENINDVGNDKFLKVVKEEKKETQKILDNMTMAIDEIANALNFFGGEMGSGLKGLAGAGTSPNVNLINPMSQSFPKHKRQVSLAKTAQNNFKDRNPMD